jgi:hypothetical protein
MSLAAIQHDLFTRDYPPVMPDDRSPDTWGLRMPVMRAFPRLAVERAEEPVLEARFDEEPERWDGMA